MFFLGTNSFLFRNIVFLAVITICISCAPTRTQYISTEETLEPGKGLVFVKVVNNSLSVSTMFVKWQYLIVKSENGKKFQLSATHSDLNSTQLFAAQLDEGNYELVDLFSSANGAISLKTNANLENQLGKFTVKDGRITSLGTIIFQPIGKDQFYLTNENIDEESIDMLTSRFKSIYSSTPNKSLIGWSNHTPQDLGIKSFRSTNAGIIFLLTQETYENLKAGDLEESWMEEMTANERLKVSKAHTVRINDTHRDNSGNLFIASNLGQVLVIPPEGELGRINTGYTYELTALNFENEKDLWIGGEHGLFINSKDNGKSWSRVETPTGIGSIIYIGKINNQLVIGANKFSEYKFFYLSDRKVNDWKEFHVEGIEDAKLLPNPMSPHRFSTKHSPEVDTVALPKSHILTIDKKTGISTLRETPFQYDQLSETPENLLVTDLEWGTQRSIFSKKSIFLSDDLAVSWTQSPAPRTAIRPVFIDQENGFALEIIQGVMSSSTDLIETKDGGKSWKKISETPQQGDSLFLSIESNRIYMSSRHQIYSFDIESKSWDRVR